MRCSTADQNPDKRRFGSVSSTPMWFRSLMERTIKSFAPASPSRFRSFARSFRGSVPLSE